MVSDKVIWNNFRNGDGEALSFIYFQHIKQLFQYGMKYTKDRDLVLDSIHDLFEYLLIKRENLGETDNIRFYLMRSLRRQLVQNLKKQEKFSKISSDDAFGPNIVFAVEEQIINAEFSKEREMKIRTALNELSPRLREILYYRFTCNLDYDQICELMSLTYDSARKMMFRALKSLKKTLSDSYILLFMFWKARS